MPEATVFSTIPTKILAPVDFSPSSRAAVVADLSGKGIKVSSSVEMGDDVASSIMEAVEREKADMIVISTHGLTGWHPLFFGSIAEKVIKLVQCPVLLLRTPKPASSAKVASGRLMEWW